MEQPDAEKEANELRLVNKVEMRIALADKDAKFEQV